MEKIYKIDFINQNENNIELVDNIIFQTAIDSNEIIELLINGDEENAYEGTSINFIDLKSIILIEYISFYNQAISFKDRFQDSNKFKTLDSVDDIELQDNSVDEYIYVQQIDFTDKPELIKELHNLNFHRFASFTENGATGFWEKYFAGVAVNITSRLFDSLKGLGIPKSCIKTYKITDDLKKFISKEFKIHPDSLILIEISSIDASKKKLEFRDIHNKYLILVDNKEIIDFKLIRL